MKMYTSDIPTQEQLQSAVTTAVVQVRGTIDEIDRKQERQIKQLRIWLVVSFVTNLLVSILLFSHV